MAIYFGGWHQRGPIAFMEHVRDTPEITELLLLMPCHATPYFSHVHRPMALQFLECLPPLPGQPPPHYDEADDFYQDPLAFLARRYPTPGGPAPPRYLAMFEPLRVSLEPFLQTHGYRVQHVFWHSLLITDARQGSILLMVRDDSNKLTHGD
jgi:phosphatidylinositol glycan class B